MEIIRNFKRAEAITHGGLFHADDVMATVFLKKRFGDFSLCRFDYLPKNVPEDILIYDIGGGKYDHHQKGGNGARRNDVPYASAGLIWRDFGKRVIRKLCEELTDEQVESVWRILDRELIAGIDAVDNGAYPKLDYPVKNASISAMISSFNPTWDSEESFDDAFLKAVKFAEGIFDNFLKNAVSDVKAKDIVEQAIEESEAGIMAFETYVPWLKYIYNSRNPKADEILFVVFPSTRGGWMWQAVNEKGSREFRKAVPAEWRGLGNEKDEAQRRESREALWLMTGAHTATFCHQTGFCGGAETIEDAIKMARVAIDCE